MELEIRGPSEPSCVFAGVSGADRHSGSQSGWNTAADTVWVHICPSSRKWKLTALTTGLSQHHSRPVVCRGTFILSERHGKSFAIVLDLFWIFVQIFSSIFDISIVSFWQFYCPQLPSTFLTFYSLTRFCRSGKLKHILCNRMNPRWQTLNHFPLLPVHTSRYRLTTQQVAADYRVVLCNLTSYIQLSVLFFFSVCLA